MDGAPYMDRVKVTWPLENSALLAAFATGQNDVLQLPDQPQLEAARAIVPGLQFSEYVAENEDALYMRVDRPPFNDLRVRRALHLGFDRQSMLGILMQGRGGLNPPGINGARTGWVIPQDELLKLPGYNSATKSQDAAEARRLLAEAGYGQGLRFKLKYNQTHTRAPQVSQVLAEQLKSIGVEAELQPTERAAFYKDQQTGNFDAYVDTVGSFDPDEGEQRRLFIAFQRLLLDKAYEISAPTPIAYAAWQPWVKDYVFNPAGQSYPLNWATLKLDTTRVPSGR